MKFGIGRNRSFLGRSVEEETIARWREASGEKGDTEETEGNEQLERVHEITLEEPEITLTDITVTQESVLPPAPHEDRAYYPKVPPSDPRLPVEEDLVRRFGAAVKAAIGPGTMIEGKLSFEAPVRIDGTLLGEVSSTSTLIVGEQGTVKATIQVGSLVVLGQVIGKVDARELVEIRNGGHLEADLQTRRIVVEEGGFFEGPCKMVA